MEEAFSFVSLQYIKPYLTDISLSLVIDHRSQLASKRSIMAPRYEDSEGSSSSPMSLRYLPPLPLPSLPPISVSPYTRRVYVPDIFPESMVYPESLLLLIINTRLMA